MPRTGRPRQVPIERFRTRMNPVDNGCIEWTGRIDRYGYGQFGTGGRSGTNVGAHRWSYEHHVGPIPDGFQIDHLCRNRKCVNPEHLEAVTPRENVLRSYSPAAVNAVKTHCVHGHPFDDENTYHTPVGGRACRICIKIKADRSYRNRSKEKDVVAAFNARRNKRRRELYAQKRASQ